VVNVIDPQLIREVFSGDGDVLRGGEVHARSFGIFGPNSVLLLDGEPHMRARRLLLPPFHGEAIDRHARLIEQVTTEEIRRWPVGEPFALLPRMRALTMEVILRAVIGVRDEPRRRQLGELLLGFARGGIATMLADTRFSWMTQGAIGQRLPWMRARAQGERLLYEEISDHRASPDGREDILAMLVETRNEDGRPLSDEQLRDQVLTLVAGGHDTSAATLAWCFERILHHPEVLARCREASSEDQEYLNAVVSETLRIRPPIDSASRKLSAPFELGGYRLPAGTIVTASIVGVHRSPELYPDPLRFSPERFLDRPAPYTFIPFGGGTRRCIGASFAMMELKTVLQTVLRHVDLRAVNRDDERASRTLGIGIAPARGVQVIATRREL
jgi:cytochrome P450 family 135